MLRLHEHRVRVGVKDAAMRRLKRAQCTAGEQCWVCQESATRSERRIELPCRHRFCEKCIAPWLRENRTCPTCRWEFPDHEVEVKS